MKAVAMIALDGSGMILPAKTPYDRDLLFEHVSSLAKRYGQVHLTVTGGRWTVAAATETNPPGTCDRCTYPVRRVVYSRGRHTLCPWCARREVR